MNSKVEELEIELICIITNFGLGSKLLRTAKHHGVSGGTITLGRGTVNNKILDFLGLSDVRKEIVFMLAGKETAYHVLEELNKEFEFNKPNHGIAYTTSVCGALGAKRMICGNIKDERGVDNIMYHSITVIVDKGKAEDVIDAATKAGSKGGTIINGRGSGIHETSKLFSMDIEPEKEMVMILSEASSTEGIAASIRENLKMDEPGNGMLYIQNVNCTYGIYK
ncbi:MAG: P-II family nitrogen regulator [Clostridiales bacterium]|jgi:nitrogen regulatory protein PII|uniref:P-II family nitrogen regulator n=1 Tax=Aminipila sp. TaxID=2060095 RepID=UPI001DEA0A5A|nr:P-II family nitrogen regulator [Aminipila sp.]MBE6033143.1 P-II family nitrogen regulator [Clostridiales bacterium]